MRCTICNKEVTLVPSAAERARKYGDHPASYYTKLFPQHSACTLSKREREVSELIARRQQDA